jgi:hypothetical protein
VAIVIPIVPDGWGKADPVPLWIRLDARGNDQDAPGMVQEKEALQAALASGPIDVLVSRHVELDHDVENSTDAFHLGALDAIHRHGLLSPETAPITSWPIDTKPKPRLKR